MNKPNNFEYLHIECNGCDIDNKFKKYKIAKNKGVDWKIFNQFLEEFLLFHSDCPIDKIQLKWE